MKTSLKVLGVLAASVVLLELVLQAAAFVAWRSLRREPASNPTASSGSRPLRILCVGDSFTFGMGASDAEHSYPSALEDWLALEHEIDARVDNQAWPAQDSRDVYRTLASRLGAERFDVVCILIGVNDQWNQPGRVEVTEVDAPATDFKWRWRSARLWRWISRERVPGGWNRRSDERQPEPTEAMLAVARRLVGEAGVVLALERPPLRNCPQDVGAALAAAEERLQASHARAAAQGLQAALSAREDPRLERKLVEVLTRLNERAEVETVLASMRARYEEGRDELAGVELLRAFSSSERAQEAFDFGRRLVEDHPASTDAWKLLAQAALMHDPSLSTLAARRYLESAGPIGHDSASVVALLGRLLAPQDRQAAGALLNAALLLQGRCAGYPYVCYLVSKWQLEPVAMARFLELEGLDERGAAILKQAFLAAYGQGSKAWLEVLRDNLRAMHALAGPFGARVFFVSYPFYGEAEEVTAAVAQETGSTFVNVRERFERELAGRARGELFVADNHCNDAGYAILAEEVGTAIARALER